MDAGRAHYRPTGQARTLPPGRIQPQFLNDCIIAASLREHGLILVTRNIEDFRLISFG
jgi:predicted nucleic acid-binding protein